jgi:AraC-like DNA-binding protein
VTSAIAYTSSNYAVSSADPITAAIGLLRPRSVSHAAIHATGEWAVRFATSPHVKLGVVARGDCWLALDESDPVRLHEGDFYLLANPPRYRLAGDLDTTPQEAPSSWKGTMVIGQEAEEETYVCGAHFAFDDDNAFLLRDVLPPVVLVRAEDPRGVLLAHLAGLMLAEIETDAVGGSLVLDHLTQIMLVHMLRAHAEHHGVPAGWLGALRDDGIGAALRAMHADVAHRWTLAELSDISRMSRSAFAASFKRQVGTAPVDYLIQWRMSLAKDALRRDTRSISELAAATGYESESAFSTAFRRVVGLSPRHYRRVSAIDFAPTGPP